MVSSVLIDLHTHTHHLSPCSSLSLDALIEHSRARGLDGLCLTEHDKLWSMEDLDRAMQKHGFLLVRGTEITTVQGHVLAYGLPAHIEGLWSLRRLHEAARAQGAFLVKSHPLRDGNFQARPDGTVSESFIDTLTMFDALEVCSGGESDAANALAASIAQSYSLKGAGGGDVHARSEIGRYATRFERTICSIDDLVTELHAGRFTAVKLHE
jgi:predicted metal-dependent phosphoesterase TrpH